MLQKALQKYCNKPEVKLNLYLCSDGRIIMPFETCFSLSIIDSSQKIFAFEAPKENFETKPHHIELLVQQG